jgi:hypothetical protein
MNQNFHTSKYFMLHLNFVIAYKYVNLLNQCVMIVVTPNIKNPCVIRCSVFSNYLGLCNPAYILIRKTFILRLQQMK